MSQNPGSLGPIEVVQEVTIQKKDNKIVQSFISGGIAGACAKTVIAPFERIKLLFVTRDRKLTYKEFYQEGKFVIQKHGVRNLWRGNSANLIRIFPFAAINILLKLLCIKQNFSTFDYLRKNIYNPYPNEKVVQKNIVLFIIGSASGVIATSACYPFEFLRTRLAMQRDNFQYKNFTDAVKTVYNSEGVRGFYSGIGLAVVGVIFYHGSGFFIMTNFKNYAKKNYTNLSQKWYTDFTFGAIGATIAQFISYPFDVMRKRKQGQSLLVSTGEQERIMRIMHILLFNYRNNRDLIKHYIKKEGIIPTFYKGITINLIKGPLSSGTVWMVKNQLNRFLDKSYDF